MNHEAMLEDIKADLDHLDAAALRSIQEIINQAKRSLSYAPDTNRSPAMPLIDIETAEGDNLQFVGENLTPEEYVKLSLQERSMLQWRLQMQNHFWLEKTFSKLNAAWLVVVDGQVIASGKSLKNLPMQPQIRRICRRTGKFPFIFVNDKFITIEEIASSWSKTKQAGDYYPTLPVTLKSASKVVAVVGDFDTGASHTFVDYDFLTAQNVIQPESEDYPIASLHLNQRFTYVAKRLQIELPFMNPQPYTAVATFEVMPFWLRFLETRQLLSASLRESTLHELRQLNTDLLKLMRKMSADPALHSAIESWAEKAHVETPS